VVAVRILPVVVVVMSAGAAQLATVRADSLSQFSSDDVWLNLHHYLYVLGYVSAACTTARPTRDSQQWPARRQGRPH